jgi:predicted DNA-binding protein (MmcQ/YjbR family)
MNAETIRSYALTFEEVEETFPFDEVTLVFKTRGKMFLLLPLDSIELSINVKCDPERAILLREEYPDTVLPGYHMNKKHWNTVMIDGRLSSQHIKSMIADSYDLVRRK